MWAGYIHVYTPGFSIRNTEGLVFTSQKFAINSVFGINQDTFYNTNLALFIKHLETPNQIASVISPLKIRFTAKNFSAKKMGEYLTYFYNLSSDALKTINLNTLENLLMHAITPSSVFHGDINLYTSLGEFSFHSKVTWHPDVASTNTFKDIFTTSLVKIRIRTSGFIVAKLIKLYGDKLKTLALTKAKYVFEQQIAQFSKQSKLTQADASQIISLANQQKDADAFAKELDKLNLTLDVANQIKQIYQLQLDAADSNEDSTQIDQQNVTVQSNEQPSSKLIDQLVQAGYLSKESGYYATTLTIENGVWRLNGWVVSS